MTDHQKILTIKHTIYRPQMSVLCSHDNIVTVYTFSILSKDFIAAAAK